MQFIIGNPRSGTTALAEFVGNIYIEPNSEAMLKFDPSKLRHKILEDGYDRTISNLNGFRGFKETTSSINKCQIEYFIESEEIDKVLIIVRNDLFASALSSSISTQIGTWHGHKDFVRERQLSRIDGNLFRSYLAHMWTNNACLLSFTKKKKVKVCCYEDLFTICDRQKRYWGEICEFLGMDFPEERWANVNSKRYNGVDTHTSVPNISELRKIYMEFIYEDSSNR